MDPREARTSLGTNHHFHPEKNPLPVGTPPKQQWLNNMVKSQPLKIARQSSTTSDGTSSPVGSPSTASPKAFDLARQMKRTMSTDDHKDSVLT